VTIVDDERKGIQHGENSRWHEPRAGRFDPGHRAAAVPDTRRNACDQGADARRAAAAPIRAAWRDGLADGQIEEAVDLDAGIDGRSVFG